VALLVVSSFQTAPDKHDLPQRMQVAAPKPEDCVCNRLSSL